MWPFLRKQHPESKRYQVTMAGLDKEVVEKLKAAGATILNKENEGYSITIKSIYEPEVVDSQGNELNSATIQKIGNGSEGIAKVIIKESKFKNPSQGVNGLMITKLVEYSGSSGGKKTAWDKTEGFKVGDEGWDEQVVDA